MKKSILDIFKQLFKPRKELENRLLQRVAITTNNGIEITYSSKSFRIQSLGSVYFCIQEISQERVKFI